MRANWTSADEADALCKAHDERKMVVVVIMVIAILRPLAREKWGTANNVDKVEAAQFDWERRLEIYPALFRRPSSTSSSRQSADPQKFGRRPLLRIRPHAHRRAHGVRSTRDARSADQQHLCTRHARPMTPLAGPRSLAIVGIRIWNKYTSSSKTSSLKRVDRSAKLSMVHSMRIVIGLIRVEYPERLVFEFATADELLALSSLFASCRVVIPRDKYKTREGKDKEGEAQWNALAEFHHDSRAM
ncbi:hypothetical protein C8R45DRAFT_937378 [Mycena sanguinolenta]|nr:hypothetical protein C8R45DRAFT_937378 [Mycena sanguinolenta]